MRVSLLQQQLVTLKTEHRALDAAVEALLEHRPYDSLKLQRLKKRKLILKDQVAQLEDQLYPDIIA
ncbi:MAG: DUF465 domain-containing protein [Alphaproteobacteria bacterium]|nr:DUF465 domain-containing protein [Alphaproteobacteria bacterium]